MGTVAGDQTFHELLALADAELARHVREGSPQEEVRSAAVESLVRRCETPQRLLHELEEAPAESGEAPELALMVRLPREPDGGPLN